MKKFLIAAAVLLPLFAHAEEAFDKNTYKRLAADLHEDEAACRALQAESEH